MQSSDWWTMKRCVVKAVELIRKKRLDRIALGPGRCDDEDWITINGTHVQIGQNGNLKGSVGAKIEGQKETGAKKQGKVRWNEPDRRRSNRLVGEIVVRNGKAYKILSAQDEENEWGKEVSYEAEDVSDSDEGKKAIAKNAALKDRRKALKNMQKTIQENDDLDGKKVDLDLKGGTVLEDTTTPQGSGHVILLKDGYVWYLENHMMDGDDWSVNNVNGQYLGSRCKADKVKSELDRIVNASKSEATTGDAEADYSKLESAGKDWSVGLSKDERKAIRGITGGSLNKVTAAAKMNEDLRKWGFPTTSAGDKCYQNAMAAIDRFEVGEPTRVYRGNSTSILGKRGMSLEEMKKCVGKVVGDMAFMSASTLPDTWSYTPVTYEIDIPKGKGIGAYVENVSIHPDEKEFLFGSGSTYKVKDVKEVGGRPHVMLEWLPHKLHCTGEEYKYFLKMQETDGVDKAIKSFCR